MKTNQTFGQAVEALKEGKVISNPSIEGKFIFRQVPSKVPAAIIPKMTSLPQTVKDILIKSGGDITYQNQFCIVHPDNSLHGWQPSASDALSSEWIIYGEHIVAGETVGTATPL